MINLLLVTSPLKKKYWLTRYSLLSLKKVSIMSLVVTAPKKKVAIKSLVFIFPYKKYWLFITHYYST
jgi:hypothetical protein